MEPRLQRLEASAVVEVDEMGHLMRDDIAAHSRGREDQAPAQADPAGRGATSPAGARVPDADQRRRGNKMARERMAVLYDQSWAQRALVIGTSNKTELLLGYGTVHGDMAHALNPLGDLYKTQVFALARALGLPQAVVEKPPSADLWEGQSDEEELGFQYAIVDLLLHHMIDERATRAELRALGFEDDFVDNVAGRVRDSQYKRRPPLIAKLSGRTIDRDFRYPRDWGH